MENNIFSLPRFNSYFKLTLRQSSYLLRLFISAVSVLVLLTTLAPFIFDESNLIFRPEYIGNHKVDVMWRIEIKYFTITFFVILSFSASYMFSAMSSKERRINTLMIPASYLEKFTTYFILYIVGAFIIFFVSAYASDLIRALISPLYLQEGSYIAPMPLEYFFSRGTCYDLDINPSLHRIETTKLGIVMTVGFAIVLQAYFALAGILWHKHAISKGIGVGIGMTALYVFTCIESVKIFGANGRFAPRWDFVDFDAILLTIEIVFLVSIITLYVISYFRFKESESINRW